MGDIVLNKIAYVAAIATILLYALKKAVNWRKVYRIRCQYECEEPSKLSQSRFLLGIDYVLDFVKQARAHRALEHLRSLHEANNYTFTAVVLGDTFIHTSEPENIKAILSSQFHEFELGPKRHRDFSPFLGNGIFTADGPRWKHSRELLRPNFTRKQLESHLSSMENHVAHLISQIPEDGSVVDLQDLFFKLTMDSSTEFLFGVSTNSLLAGTEEYMRLFSEAFEAAQWGVSLRPRLGVLNNFYTSRKFLEASKVVHDYVDALVQRALLDAKYDHSEKTHSALRNVKYCFLEELAKTVQDPRELRDHAVNVLIAGRDTTAGLLAITFWLLARHPNVWDRLRMSVDHLNGRHPSFEQLKDMSYLQSVLKEVLRLYPTTPLNNRHAKADTTLPVGGGVHNQSKIFVRKGQRVTYAVYAMHRRKDIFGQDADEFRPERWDDLRPGWHYLPFNGGPRTCLGQQFALTESAYVIVRLMQQFKAIEPRDERPFTEQLGLTLASQNGTLVSLRT